MLLNKNAEYMIGKTIVWFNDGYIHYIDNQDENLLQQIKSNPLLSKNKSEVKTKVMPVPEDDKSTMGTIGGTSLYAWYQKPWALNCASGWWRKTVYELVSTAAQLGPYGQNYAFEYTVFIRIKLEWWGSGGWQQNAGERRVVDVNLSGSVGAQCNVVTPPPFNFFRTYDTNSDITINLTGDNKGVAIQNNNYDCDGLIYYSINGYIRSKVYMNGTCNGTLQTDSQYDVPGPSTSGTLW
ncbi:hypothetical protein GCM10028807_36150 [Spirosoma daeguense]